MKAEKIVIGTVRKATRAIDALGSTNSELMATRAVHINILARNIPGRQARLLKRTYNDVGAEVAVSHEVYYEEEDVVTDIIVMGTVYQHREVRRILRDSPLVASLIAAIEVVVENASETVD
ncbi:MAG: hypothetical protein P8182_20195 [Deltaproteobacteria bacterium]